VETMHFGESCRLLLLDGELLHAVRRRGLRVRGDGQRAVRELLPAGLTADRTVRHTLEQQDRSLDHVPGDGEELLVRSLPLELNESREPRTVYDESITEVVHPELVEAARSIAAAFGTRFAGVDFVTCDPRLPLTGAAVFLELNTTPGIHHHDIEPSRRPLPVAVRVLSSLLCVSTQRPVFGTTQESGKEKP